MRKFMLLLLCLVITKSSFGWGQKGHDVIAYVAECHLSPKAAKQIDKILDGHSMVYYSSWMDNASHTDEYSYTKTWHYVNIDEGKTVKTMPKNPKGDALVAVESIIEKLKSGTLSPEEETVNLKLLVHLVGDMHCPMHTGRLSDRGGNNVKLKFFSSNSNLHSIWDSSLIEAAHKWGYTEWRNQIDIYSKKENEAIQAGTPTQWVEEAHDISKDIYENTPAGARISYDYIAKYSPVIEKQLLHGGLRLARILNEIYK